VASSRCVSGCPVLRSTVIPRCVAARYKERQREEREKERRAEGAVFTNKDFHYDPQRQRCICPAAKKLYRNGWNVVINGYRGVKFCAPKNACRPATCGRSV